MQKQFVSRNIICRFGLPKELTDNGKQFIRKAFIKFYKELKIRLCRSSPYKAQANGQVESSYKIMISILKKSLEKLKRNGPKNF